jgi:hypothetical protein
MITTYPGCIPVQRCSMIMPATTGDTKGSVACIILKLGPVQERLFGLSGWVELPEGHARSLQGRVPHRLPI